MTNQVIEEPVESPHPIQPPTKMEENSGLSHEETPGLKATPGLIAKFKNYLINNFEGALAPRCSSPVLSAHAPCAPTAVFLWFEQT